MVDTLKAAPPRRRTAPEQPRVAHLTPEERAARGRAARGEVPRSAHAQLLLPPGQRDAVGLLERQAVTRVPELLPIRYGRMAASSFAFFRGAAAVMAADLAGVPRSGLTAQVCGDAHLSNFGVYAAPDRRLVFDINDFDETLPGPWEWDVKRLAASLAILGRDRGFPVGVRERIVTEAVSGYRRAMRDFAGMSNLEVWYARFEVEQATQQLAQLSALQSPQGKGRSSDNVRRVERALDKARARTSLQAYNKLVTTADGQPRFISDPPLVQPIEELVTNHSAADLEQFFLSAIRSYRRTLPEDRRHLLETYQYVCMARKVVGVGSVGTRAWVMLLLGRDTEDPLIMQVKEAQPSVLEPYVGRSRHSNAGQRVVAGQQLMQAASDIFLGWHRVGVGLDGQSHDYYIRQLRDGKASVLVDTVAPESLAWYAGVCGWTLARAHARSGDRIAIAAYLGGGDPFDRAMVKFAETYADQNEQDHDALVRAIADGRLAAEAGA